jgi:hypothetical protein
MVSISMPRGKNNPENSLSLSKCSIWFVVFIAENYNFNGK